ncbi:MAG: DUF669 domain-containing protein [Planctomycetaceae bacterium]|nr:DUF669 domain-containing protein [Planctomycetaceae bacterium]
MSIENFLGFNPQQTEGIEELGERREPVPEGTYKVVAAKAERQHTKEKKGWFWYFLFVIIGGEYDGKTLEHRFNIVNPSDDAQRIGQGQMKRFLEAIKVLEPENEEAMYDIPFMVTVKCRKNSYVNKKGVQVDGISNEIVRFDPLGQSDATPPAAKSESAATDSGETKDDSAPWD